MKEFVPLLSSSTDDFERALLHSVESDDLGAAGLLKTASLLGLGASAVLPAIATSHGLTSGAAAALWPIVVKWLGLGMFLGLALGGTAGLLSTRAPRAVEPERAAQLTQAPPTRALSLIAHDEGTPEPLLSAQNAAPALATAHRVAPAGLPEPPRAAFSAVDSPSVAAFASATPALAGAESIAEQVRVIERAREALAASRATDALSAVSSYRARWPRGELIPEAIVIGVRAKKMLGDAAGAERDARALIARDPESRYAAQLRTLLGVPPSP